MHQRNVKRHQATVQFSSVETHEHPVNIQYARSTVPQPASGGNYGDGEFCSIKREKLAQVQLHNDEMDAYLQMEASS